MCGKGSHDTLVIEVKGKCTEDSLCCSLYWISAPSYGVYMMRKKIYNATSKCGLEYHCFTYQFNRLRIILDYEPAVILKNTTSNNEEK